MKFSKKKVFLRGGVKNECFDESPIFVGRLAINARKIWFEYDPDFIHRGLLLSPFKMPLQMGAMACEDPVFQWLLQR